MQQSTSVVEPNINIEGKLTPFMLDENYFDGNMLEKISEVENRPDDSSSSATFRDESSSSSFLGFLRDEVDVYQSNF